MSDLSIYRQIKNALKRLIEDFKESKNFNLTIAIVSFIAGIFLFIYLFYWADLTKYKDIVGPLTTAAGGMIAFAIAYQLREFARDRRRLKHIKGLQNEVGDYNTTTDTDDR